MSKDFCFVGKNNITPSRDKIVNVSMNLFEGSASVGCAGSSTLSEKKTEINVKVSLLSYNRTSRSTFSFSVESVPQVILTNACLLLTHHGETTGGG